MSVLKSYEPHKTNSHWVVQNIFFRYIHKLYNMCNFVPREKKVRLKLREPKYNWSIYFKACVHWLLIKSILRPFFFFPSKKITYCVAENVFKTTPNILCLDAKKMRINKKLRITAWKTKWTNRAKNL